MLKLSDYSRDGSRTNRFNEMRKQANLAIDINVVLWDVYMVMNHGTNEERLKMLDRLEIHFDGISPEDPRTK